MSRLVSLGIAAGLAACAVGPDYHMPETVVPDTFLSHSSEPSLKSSPRSTADLTEWWRVLHDPELDALIARAIRANPDIEIAMTRLQEARTQEIMAISASLPSVDGTGGGGVGTGSDLTRGRASPVLRSGENSANLQKINRAGGFEATWELDVFGRFQRELEAATYDAEALADARDWVLATVAADVARAYIDMRALQREVAVLQKNIAVAKRSVDFVSARFERGLTNEMDLTLAQRQLATLQANAPPLGAQIAASQHVIAVLLGQFPEDLAKELSGPGLMPTLPAHIPVGLPVDLLRRRPDIQAAERRLAAATAGIGIATADLFPTVTLSGAGGVQGGPHTSSAVPITLIGSFGPSIYWPVLDFGALDAKVDIAGLQAHELMVSYKQTILAAVQQVDDAIASYRAQQERLRDLDRALDAARRATKLASERYDRGLTDFLNVLDAERQEFDLEGQHVMTRQMLAEQLVALYKALGGGWPLLEVLPPIRQPQPAVIAAARRLLAPAEDR